MGLSSEVQCEETSLPSCGSPGSQPLVLSPAKLSLNFAFWRGRTGDYSRLDSQWREAGREVQGLWEQNPSGLQGSGYSPGL